MVKKIYSILIMALILFAFFSAYSYTQALSIDNIIGGANELVNEGKPNANNVINFDVLGETSNLVYNLLLILGVCVAVIVATVLGIQFITGSVEQKVKVKETLIPFVIGCAVLFGAFGIWRLVIILLR